MKVTRGDALSELDVTRREMLHLTLHLGRLAQLVRAPR